MDKPKLCTECRYHYWTYEHQKKQHLCANPINLLTNVVDGEHRGANCIPLRSDPKNCGEGGKFWELAGDKIDPIILRILHDNAC